jgi:hypothetical protein
VRSGRIAMAVRKEEDHRFLLKLLTAEILILIAAYFVMTSIQLYIQL